MRACGQKFVKFCAHTHTHTRAAKLVVEMLHTNDLTTCVFSYRPISTDFTFSVNCLMTCQCIDNRTFISVELLLSVVTIDPNNLNLSTR